MPLVLSLERDTAGWGTGQGFEKTMGVILHGLSVSKGFGHLESASLFCQGLETDIIAKMGKNSLHDLCVKSNNVT